MVRVLLLLRHAKSSWADPTLSDYDRPLNDRGLADAPRIAAHIAGEVDPPTLVVSSGAARAKATAMVLAEALGIGPEAVVIDDDLYEAGFDEVLQVIRRLPHEHRCVAVVGHNPGISAFVNEMTYPGVGDMPTAAVARVSLPGQASWRSLWRAGGRLLGYTTPRMLREASGEAPVTD